MMNFIYFKDFHQVWLILLIDSGKITSVKIDLKENEKIGT